VQPRSRQITVERSAKLGELPPEGGKVVVLGFVAHGAPLRVVAVLLTATRIDAGSEEVTARAAANPYVPPSRRERELADPLELGRVAEELAARQAVNEGFAALDALDARLAAADVPKARLLGEERRRGHLRDKLVVSFAPYMGPITTTTPGGVTAKHITQGARVVPTGTSRGTRFATPREHEEEKQHPRVFVATLRRQG
jgi:hypothetical protein